MTIRNATLDDAEAITAIYAHHVLFGTASFDTDPPDIAYWCNRIVDIGLKSWPFIVAERNDAVVGYAYATQFRDRAAYIETCENSIYVAHDTIGSGVGTLLISALVERAAASGFRQMIAVIGGGEPASVVLHAKAGFAPAGRMKNVGRKFGRLLDTVYMQRALGAAQDAQDQ